MSVSINPDSWSCIFNFILNVISFQMFKWIVLLHASFHTPHVHERVGLLFNLAPKSSLLCHPCVASVSTIHPKNENRMPWRDGVQCRDNCWWKSQCDALHTVTGSLFPHDPNIPSCVSNEKILCAWGGHMDKKGHNELWFFPQQNIKQQWEWGNRNYAQHLLRNQCWVFWLIFIKFKAKKMSPVHLKRHIYVAIY